jgi:ABC-type Zn uptake system ZnuABC Zn-binding protein ZnuA
MRRSVLLATLLMLILSGCGSSADPSDSTSTPSTPSKIRIVTTTPVLTDFASIVGSELVEVYGLVKAGVDPHDYEPNPADITAIARANLIIRNGLGLETWLDDTIDSAESRAVQIEASEGVVLRKKLDGEVDPHIWHNPLNAKIMVNNIRRGLERVDPTNSSVYAATEGAYAAQLDALDRDIRSSLSRLTNRKVVTNHDSLGYYIDAYRLEFVGSVIPSFDTQAELSSAQISSLVAKVKAEKVPAIFAESSLPPAAAETIAKEAGVKVITGAKALYGDSLGRSGSSTSTYLEMERHNTSVLVNNLG